MNTEYYHDGQMPMEDSVINGAALTATRYGLGTRGIDYEEAASGSWTSSSQRSTGSFSNVGFPIYDAHGNMVATLVRSGVNGYQVNNQRSYDAWGVIRSGVGTSDPKNRYCASLGHQQDDESGLIYMRARYYDSSSGRFISEDSQRKGSSWFIYAGNCPVAKADSSGKDNIFIDPSWEQINMWLFEMESACLISPLALAILGPAVIGWDVAMAVDPILRMDIKVTSFVAQATDIVATTRPIGVDPLDQARGEAMAIELQDEIDMWLIGDTAIGNL